MGNILHGHCTYCTYGTNLQMLRPVPVFSKHSVHLPTERVFAALAKGVFACHSTGKFGCLSLWESCVAIMSVPDYLRYKQVPKGCQFVVGVSTGRATEDLQRHNKSSSPGQVDPTGNVNVSNFAGRVPGVGGFADIASNAKMLVFCTTLTCGNLITKVEDGKLIIVQEGSIQKFKKAIGEITFPSASQGSRRVMFVTERCVMELRSQKLVVTELAAGMTLDDVFSNMEFKPEVDEQLGAYDPRIFER